MNNINDNITITDNSNFIENIETEINDFYIRSNSPLTMSDHNSIEEHNNSSDEEINREIQYRVEHSFENKYNDKLDILLTFIKGQKHFYSHCNRICKNKLHMLMIPCMFISSLNAILSSIFVNESWANALSSALNTVILLLISMMNYLKYESSAEAFLAVHHNFDKLETSIKLIHTNINTYQEEDTIINKIQDIENKIHNIKEYGIPSIPIESRNMFPIICQVNISSLIRKMEIYKSQLYSKFSDIKNEIKYIFMNSKQDTENINHIENLKQKRQQNRLLQLYKQKDEIKEELSQAALLYSHIDNIFSKEIRHANKYSCIYCFFCYQKKMTYIGLHPVIDKYFEFIFDGN